MEEDIKILEETIDLVKRTGIDMTLVNKIENLLTRYKQLEEENKRIKSLDIYKLVEDYETGQLISVSKIKEKIEARESSIADIKDNFVINEGMTIEIKRLETEIDVLQGLLKEEYEKGE